MDVTLEDFKWQIEWLGTNREIVDLDTAIQRWDEPNSESLVVLTFDDGYEDTFREAFPILQRAGFPFTVYLATRAIESGSFESGDQPLEWGQIERMVTSGLMTVGSHTHSHRDLRRLSHDEVAIELQTADVLIEKHTGIRPRHFAYPYGYWSESAHQPVSERYETAVLGSPPIVSSNTDRHRIHRFPVQLSDGRRWFRSRVSGGLRLEEAVRRRLRGYSGP